MLELRNITKIYETEDDVEYKALDDISISFRRNEFVAVLGPSGSGKTTLLNVVGGLDHYTSGDLDIEGVSTKNYDDRDWDAYRNRRIGFVFQNYNLIPHQSILQNVEIALTLSGVNGAEKKQRASDILEKVGLGEHLQKRPSQLSGGQMQRVAIARALVNDPDIILADEPTGALDSRTSVQIMDLLKSIAKDKLVIMVTHNPELAEKYATRVVTVKDGRVVGDTNPFEDNSDSLVNPKMKYSSLGLGTALGLSFNNLLTKRGRTFLTAFAGSIGIIGIALILALANGVNQKATDLISNSSVPSDITVDATYVDDNIMVNSDSSTENVEKVAHPDTVVAKDDMSSASYVETRDRVRHNDVVALRDYINQNQDKLTAAVENIKYDYGLPLEVFDRDAAGEIIKVNPIVRTTSTNVLDQSDGGVTTDVKVDTIIRSSFAEITNDKQYDVLSGKLPENANELLLVVNTENELPLTTVYALNLEDRTKLMEIIDLLNANKKPSFADISYNFDGIVGKTYRVIPSSENAPEEISAEAYAAAKELTVVGVAKVKNQADVSGYMGYTHALVEEMTPESAKANPKAVSFYAKTDNDKNLVKKFLDDYNNSVADAQKVYYVDRTEAAVKAIRNLVNLISYVLVGFVAISLVVSSIMIGIITYISVLERTKEIGILRAIGASKKDVIRVFRAETMIEGLVAGVLGISISASFCASINVAVSTLAHVDNIANISVVTCLILIAISVILTVLAGALPARRASKKDPVEALRSE